MPYYLLWITLQDFERILENSQNGSQCRSSLSDSLRFTHATSKGLVRVDLIVEFKLQNFFRFSN